VFNPACIKRQPVFIQKMTLHPTGKSKERTEDINCENDFQRAMTTTAGQ
jgi:hypothetical protein